ncbi:MAG TPA: phosphotransferase [Mycobacteriales bacterium]|nr:phosphotransferase [Mycobacteriales bacterium]
MISWLRSLPTAESLGEFIAEQYGFSVRSCVLLRSLANQVYELRTDSTRFAVKVYRAGGWSAEEVAWEQELVAHAIDRGVPCAAPVPLPDGRWCAELDSPEGPRPVALSAFVEGVKPRPPFDAGLFGEYGRLIAAFHTAAEDFRTSSPRRPWDLEAALERPLRELRVEGRDAMIADLADYARTRLSAHPPAWGIRHGDVSLDNLHRTDLGLVLHDFDLAGPGWPAADLTGVRATERWEDFAAGYRTVRELPDLSALPALDICGLISNLHFHLVRKPLYRGSESIGEGWADREIARLEQLHAELS